MSEAVVGGMEAHTDLKLMEIEAGMKIGHCLVSSKLLTYHNEEAELPSVTCSRRKEPNHKDHRSHIPLRLSV